MNWFYLFVAIGIFASSCSQLLLKASADKKYTSRIAELLNWRVILAYVIFLGSMLVNALALGHGVNLKDMPILESLGYVFVPVLSYMFLHEKISFRLLISIMFIALGIIVFYA